MKILFVCLLLLVPVTAQLPILAHRILEAASIDIEEAEDTPEIVLYSPPSAEAGNLRGSVEAASVDPNSEEEQLRNLQDRRKKRHPKTAHGSDSTHGSDAGQPVIDAVQPVAADPAAPLKIYTVPSSLQGPQGICIDSANNIYVAEFLGSAVTKVLNPPIMVAGRRWRGYSGDGGLATAAMLIFPNGIAVDTHDNMYIADTFNRVVRKVMKSTGIITTVAGTGEAHGLKGDGGLATSALLSVPNGVAVDSLGNIYIADTENQCIRKVAVDTGIITTVAGIIGQYGYEGDGGLATLAKLKYPYGVAIDKSDNFYIADTYNRAVRKVTVSTGIISNVAGTGQSGYKGDGGLAITAFLHYPFGIAVAKNGDVYIADTENFCIRKVAVDTGIITTFAGTNNVPGNSLSGTVATKAFIGEPYAIAIDNAGLIYFTDAVYNTVKVIR